jgi:hypothetical protein
LWLGEQVAGAGEGIPQPVERLCGGIAAPPQLFSVYAEQKLSLPSGKGFPYDSEKSVGTAEEVRSETLLDGTVRCPAPPLSGIPDRGKLAGRTHWRQADEGPTAAKRRKEDGR